MSMPRSLLKFKTSFDRYSKIAGFLVFNHELVITFVNTNNPFDKSIIQSKEIVSRGGPPFWGCMLMNSRGRPPHFARVLGQFLWI